MVGNFTILSCWPGRIIELFVCHFWSGLMVGSVTFGSQCYCAGGHFPLRWLIFSVAKGWTIGPSRRSLRRHFLVGMVAARIHGG